MHLMYLFYVFYLCIFYFIVLHFNLHFYANHCLYPSIRLIHSLPLIEFRDAGSATIRREAGYTDRSWACHMANTHSPSPPPGWWEEGVPGENPYKHGENMQLHTERRRSDGGFDPRTFLVWGNRGNPEDNKK